MRWSGLLAALLCLSPVVAAHTADGGGGGTAVQPPDTAETAVPPGEKICPFNGSVARQRQRVYGVTVQRSEQCRPDDPAVVAAVTRGTNNVPMRALMETGLAGDAVEKCCDRDGDGDPDVINITLEVAELNGAPTASGVTEVAHTIAPGIRPGFWVFAPKTRGMATEGAAASELLRMPSPVVRVEEDDEVHVTLENTHYMPHTIHFHGTDHAFMDGGKGNDGVPQTSEEPVLPGGARTYDMTPREPGTMFYHCHVQPSVHVLMGLNGMFVVAEEAANNTVQTLNIGAGRVRHPSAATADRYAAAYDLQYQGVDSDLHSIVKETNDPRVLQKRLHRDYDVTEREPDYFLLNGRSFPYTVRESQVIVEQDRRYRLRVLNGGSEPVSLHTHGHKPTITHYDGVPAPPEARISRDVFDVSAAQRLDLALNTTDNGRDSYGPGVWFMHDHREQAVTTDGVSPGGGISLITYRSHLQNGAPQVHGVDWGPYFTADYYERHVPVWAWYASRLLGDVSPRTPPLTSYLPWILAGLLLGAGVAWTVMRR